ncbi:hypothetical protein [Streptomyces sp. NPDC045369]|uniref:hypothetical protein n=1 Tax=Streptomyces sp. NPDC045369 TaxID=3155732 RepID=UPI0033F7F05D
MAPGLAVSAYGLQAPTWLGARLAALGFVSFAPELGHRKRHIRYGPVVLTRPDVLTVRTAWSRWSRPAGT